MTEENYKIKYETLLDFVKTYMNEVAKNVRDIEKLQNAFRKLKEFVKED